MNDERRRKKEEGRRFQVERCKVKVEDLEL
jgi:hypothetical protein